MLPKGQGQQCRARCNLDLWCSISSHMFDAPSSHHWHLCGRIFCWQFENTWCIKL